MKVLTGSCLCGKIGIHVPAKTPRQLMNNSPENLRFLVISQPMSHGDRVNV